MSRRETDEAGTITRELQEIKAGRRVSLEFPVVSLTGRCKYVSVVVLDLGRIARENSSECSCAALLVPRRRDKEWVYSSEGGQWQLLASAGVSRLIVIFPQRDDPVKQVRCQNSLDRSAATVSEDEELRTILRPLVLALTPKILFSRGIPDIPFVNYADNVDRRVEIEVAYSPLTGLIKVEDVELRPESEHEQEVRLSPQSRGREVESSEPESPSTKTEKIWIRRLIFHRMPNLIQTAVPLITLPVQDLEEHCRRGSGMGSRKIKRSSSRRRESSQEAQTGEKRVVDHSRLVHKYLPPIIAGLVLISPCLDELTHSQHKAKVLCIGLGGGALPMFLHNLFGFHVQVVDLDEVVLDLARRHFGLKEGPNLEIIVGDGLGTVTMIARRAKKFGLDNEYRRNWRDSSGDKKKQPRAALLGSATEIAPTQETTRASEGNLSHTTRFLSTPEEGTSVCERVTTSGYASEFESTLNDSRDGISAGDTAIPRSSELEMVSQSTVAQQGEMDPRLEMIVVDVDEGDARSELSSPPLAFIEGKFLTSARIALQEGGMLVMNVISSGEKAYSQAIEALLAIFENVYEIPLEDGVHQHHVVLALPKPSCYPILVGPTVDLVQKVVHGPFIQQIRKTKPKSTNLAANSAP